MQKLRVDNHKIGITMDADVEPEPCRGCGTPIPPGFGWCAPCDEAEARMAEERDCTCNEPCPAHGAF